MRGIGVAGGSSAASNSSRNFADASLNANTSSAGSFVVGDNSASCSRSVRGKRNRPGVGAACGSRKDSFASRDTSNTGTAATTGTVLTT